MMKRIVELDVTDAEADALGLEHCTAEIEIWDDGYDWGAKCGSVEIPETLTRVWARIREMV